MEKEIKEVTIDNATLDQLKIAAYDLIRRKMAIDNQLNAIQVRIQEKEQELKESGE